MLVGSWILPPFFYKAFGLLVVGHLQKFPFPSCLHKRGLTSILNQMNTDLASKQAMALSKSRLKPFCILVLILISQMTLGTGQLFDDNANKASDAMSKIHIRKALLEIELDYEDGGANNKHDPRKGKPGIGVRSP